MNKDSLNSNKKRLITITAIAVIVCGFAIFGFSILRGFFYYPEKEMKISPTKEAIAPEVFSKQVFTNPSRLIIPKININASVLALGLTEKGNMAAPHNFIDVGWYKYGPMPGEVGSSVIDGHVDNGFSTPAVFKHLKELAAGDDIYVVEGNKKLHFVVSNIERYLYTAAPLELIFNQNDERRLNLITCDGDWVAKDKTADHRIVVYSVLKDISENKI